MHRHELTEAQWSKISTLVPQHGRRSIRGDRNFVNAVVWLLRTGTPWRDLPERFGNWKTVYNRFANWSKSGRWEKIFKALQLKRDKRGVLADATIARAHQDASGGKGGPDAKLWAALAEVFRPSSTLSPTPEADRFTSSSRLANKTKRRSRQR